MTAGLEPQVLKHRYWTACGGPRFFPLLFLFVQIPFYLHIYLVLIARMFCYWLLDFIALHRLFRI